MKENEMGVSSSGITQQEFSKEDKIARPLYGAIAWTGFSIGTIVIALTSPRHNGQDIYQDNMTDQVKVERQIPSVQLKALLDEGSVTSGVISDPQVIKAEAPQQPAKLNTQTERVESSLEIQGPATYYGVDDEYGLEDSLGCTGEPFDPYDPETAARPYNSPFVCGDKLEVCDADSCIDVEVRDTCPGCDDWGIVIDLSYGAMGKLTEKHGTAMVTIREK